MNMASFTMQAAMTKFYTFEDEIHLAKITSTRIEFQLAGAFFSWRGIKFYISIKWIRWTLDKTNVD
jgi:hypothetical protein